MARYNREFLVPYLEDICALHLSKQKIRRMIDASIAEIDRISRTALEKVEAPQLESYKTDEDMPGIGSGCISGVFALLGLVSFGWGLVTGELVMMLIMMALFVGAACYFSVKWSGAKGRENKDIKERNDAKEREHAIEQVAALTVVEPEVEAIKERIKTLEGEIDKINALLEQQYSINVIPGWYRDLYPAVYLYDWFSNSRADDLDVALNTLVLEQIKDRLDTIIRNQGEMIINQRIMIANQKKSMEQAERHHAEQMTKLNRIEASNEDRNMYLSMIEANTAANAYFAAANYLK